MGGRPTYISIIRNSYNYLYSSIVFEMESNTDHRSRFALPNSPNKRGKPKDIASERHACKFGWLLSLLLYHTG